MSEHGPEGKRARAQAQAQTPPKEPVQTQVPTQAPAPTQAPTQAPARVQAQSEARSEAHPQAPMQAQTPPQTPVLQPSTTPASATSASASATSAPASASAAAPSSPAGLPPAVHAFLVRFLPTRLDSLPNDAVLLLGIALVLAVVDPTKLGTRGPVGWLLVAVALVAAIWAAPVVSRRPTARSVHLANQLARHRNTAFAVGCTIVAGFGDPPVWLMIVDATLLLAYLLAVDALAAGPIGMRQLRQGVAPLSAAGAVAIVLLAAQAPVNSGAVWGRIVAALAVAVAGVAAGAALWIKQTSGQPAEAREEAARPEPSTRPRHR